MSFEFKEEVLENHKKYLERKKVYMTFGYDIDWERDFILGCVKPLAGRVLEIGTGKGHFTLALAREGVNLTSVDISAREQQFACYNLSYYDCESRVDFRIEDASRLSFSDGSFETICSVNVMHHLKGPLQVAGEMLRVFSRQGKIVISDFSKEGFKMIEEFHASEGRVHENAKVTIEDIASFFRQNGLDVNLSSSRFQDVLIASFKI